MAEYDLRKAFPINGKGFRAGEEEWVCHLAEVSDLRPEQEELSWYLVFERQKDKAGDEENHRKLELVTGPEVIEKGWRDGLEGRVNEWLASGEEDGRVDLRE